MYINLLFGDKNMKHFLNMSCVLEGCNVTTLPVCTTCCRVYRGNSRPGQGTVLQQRDLVPEYRGPSFTAGIDQG